MGDGELANICAGLLINELVEVIHSIIGVDGCYEKFGVTFYETP